jgi:hypothetical protein
MGSINLAKIRTSGHTTEGVSKRSTISFKKLGSTIARTIRYTNDRNEIIKPSSAILKQKPEITDEEAVFLFKPGVLSEKVDVSKILDLGLNMIAENNWNILTASIISGSYLQANDTIVKHYGVASKVAKEGPSAVSQEGKNIFKSLFNIDIEGKDRDGNPIVFGAFEFMAKFNYTVPQISKLWLETSEAKLAPRTHVTEVPLGNKKVFLLNGFNPGQIEDFTKEKDRIVILHVRKGKNGSSLKEIRQNAIGPTDPSNGTGIRNKLFTYKNLFGVDRVDSSWNGFHFSAGNIDAIWELNNFFGVSPETTIMGRLLMEKASYGSTELYKIIKNPILQWGGKNKTTYDHTELLAPDKIIEFATAVRDQL